MPDPGAPGPDRRRERRRRIVGRRITDLAAHPDLYVSPEQVAEYFQVPLKTVMRKWVVYVQKDTEAEAKQILERGLLPARWFPGRHTRIKVKHLVWFERHPRHPDTPKAL